MINTVLAADGGRIDRPIERDRDARLRVEAVHRVQNVDGSVNLKSGDQVSVVHAAQDAAANPSATMRLRDVLSIQGGKLVVTRYGTSVHDE